MHQGKMILTITEQKVIAQFERKGGTQTLFALKGVDGDGQLITEELRSFAECEIGRAVEYDVTRYDDERHGVSWTLKRPSENLSRRVAALEKTVADLTDRLSAVEGSRS